MSQVRTLASFTDFLPGYLSTSYYRLMKREDEGVIICCEFTPGYIQSAPVVYSPTGANKMADAVWYLHDYTSADFWQMTFQ